jgi:hypothetical protein
MRVLLVLLGLVALALHLLGHARGGGATAAERAGQAPWVMPGPLSPQGLAPLEVVARSAVHQRLARLADGEVVLDMESLESLEAAEDLVQQWRLNHSGDAQLVCWLAISSVADLGADMRALSARGCDKLRIALDAGSEPDPGH